MLWLMAGKSWLSGDLMLIVVNLWAKIGAVFLQVLQKVVFSYA